MRSLFGALVLSAVSGCAGTTTRTPTTATPAGPVELVVAATTDIHGRVRGWNYDLNAADSAVGLARAATIIDSLRGVAGAHVVLVDAGDILQGNLPTRHTR